MDDLIGVSVQPIEFAEVKGTPLEPLTLPEASVRNRAATISYLSDPSQMVENYNAMMAEGADGGDSISTGLATSIQRQVNSQDETGLMSIMADPKIPLEEKIRVAKQSRDSVILKDNGTTLLTRSLAKDSAGETPEAERARVDTTAQDIAAIYKARESTQGIINAYMAKLDSGTGRALYEMADETIAPLSTNVLTAALTNGKENASIWDVVKAFVDPGKAKMDIKKSLESLPVDQREQATREVLELISKNSRTLLSSDNDYAKFKLAQELLQDGNYDNFDRWFDTLAGALDVFGVGGALRASKSTKPVMATKVPTNVQQAVDRANMGVPTAPKVVQQGDLASTSQVPTKGVFDERINALEAQKASMMGDASNLLGKGEVTSLTQERKGILNSIPDRNELAKNIQAQQGITSKEAKLQADKLIADKRADVDASVSRIDNILKQNAEASTLTQRIADIEKEIKLLQGRNTEVVLKKNYMYSVEVERVEMNAVTRLPQPASPIEILKLANPQEARNIHTAIVMDTTEEVAKASSNSSRVQAIANNILPQVATDGKVNVGVVDIDRNLLKIVAENPKLAKALEHSVDNVISAKELAQSRYQVVNKFKDALGLTIRENMASFSHDGLKSKISAVYGTGEGDFNKAMDAFNQAKYSLSNTGVLDSEIEILARRGDKYEPVALDEVKDVPGSYLVRVNTEHTIDPTEVTFLEKDTVKYNWLDRGDLRWDENKGASAILMDYASMLSPRYTGGAVVGVDKSAKFEKLMLEIANDYAESYNSLKKSERVALDKYFIDANFNGKALDPNEILYVRGLSQKALEAAVKWRKFWDSHYYLENLDMVRTFNAQGWQKFGHKNAELFAKPISKDSTIGQAYDADLDQVVNISKQDADALYNAGGTYARLRRPADFGGEVVDHIIVRNNASSYLRKIRDNDKILNYREGYFQVQYKAARFIDEYKMVNGREVRRAVAVAGDTAEALHIESRLNANASPMSYYKQRADERAMVKGSDDWFDVESVSGRIAQRHRGKILEGADSTNQLNRPELIVDPVTAATRAARSISGRTVMRPVLDMSKERWMANHGHLVTANKFGEKRFPPSHSEFGTPGGVTKEVADARTTWNYINYLENGYINGLDNLHKSVMNMIAETAGEFGATKIERGANVLKDYSPTHATKGSVFNAMIATNPIRQLLVQVHQGVRTFAYNPTGWATSSVPRLALDYVMNVAFKRPGNAEFARFVDESGMLDAVDKNSLVRGSLKDAADNSTFGRAVKAAGKPFDVLRQAGFDTGERLNNIVHLAAVYDKFKREGKNLADSLVMDEARSVARAVSYDMNAAGDMLYNQTSAGIILQFMQVPHKAILNYTNRRIPLDARMRLAIGDTLFWGGPAYLISEWFNTELPEDPYWRDFITQGLEGAALNHLFQTISGDEDLRMDWSSLAPADMTGMAKVVTTLLTDGPLKALANSPANQMFGEEGRVRTAMLTASRFFAGSVSSDYETPVTLTQVVTDFAKISSGFSNATKAYMMLELDKKLTAQGVTVKDNPTFIEAMSQIAGFQDITSKARFEFVERQSASNKSMEEDIKKDVKAIAKYYQDQYGMGISDPEQLTAMTGMIMRRYQGNAKASEIANKYIAQSLADPDSRLLSIILETSKFPNPKVFRERLKDIPMEDYKKQGFESLMNNIENYRE